MSALSVLNAQEISFSGSLTAQAGIGLPSTHDNEGHFLVGTTDFDCTVKAYLGSSMVYINPQLIYDALGGQSSNGTDSFVAFDGKFALKLREAYFDYNGGSWAIRAGRQIAAWGKADGIQVADILCPQDTSTMIASNYKESRLGIDALRFSYIRDILQVDLYWIPFFTPSTLPLAKGNPLNKIIFPSSFDGYEIFAPESQDDFDLPEKKFSSCEYAIRASAYLSKLDVSFYAFYGWDDLPFISYVPLIYDDEIYGIDLKGTYERLLMFGCDAAVPHGDFVFRAEGAYFPNRYMQTTVDYQKSRAFAGKSVDAAEKYHQFVGLLGVDWDVGSGLTVMAQYVGDIVFGSDIDDIERHRYIHQATASVTKSLLNDSLSLYVLGALDFWDLSAMIDAEASYNLSDAITVTLIGNFYIEGPTDNKGIYGSYRDLSCLTLKGKISF